MERDEDISTLRNLLIESYADRDRWKQRHSSLQMVSMVFAVSTAVLTIALIITGVIR